MYLAAPEDVVIGKLRWGVHSESEKQQRDVLAIFKVQQSALNYQYLYYWAERFEAAEQLERLVVAAGVQEISSKQWGDRFYPIAQRLFAAAKEAGRVVTAESGEETVLGKRYDLLMDSRSQVLSVVGSTDGRQVAQLDNQGHVLLSAPTLSDRRYWREIAQRKSIARGEIHYCYQYRVSSSAFLCQSERHRDIRS